MLKLLVFVMLAVIVYRLLRPGKPSVSGTDKKSPVEKMVTCAQCGIHFPEREAVLGGDRIFCSEQHRDAWTPSR